MNQSSAEYNPNLSKPGALENLDKSYASVFALDSKRSQQDLDYDIIRQNQKSTNNDISLMTDFQSRQNREDSIGRDTYDQKLKACIPGYNIKTVYNQVV